MLSDRLASLVGSPLDLAGAAAAISRIPYGRPRDRSPAGVLDEWTGTCSTKHALFAAVVAEAWPERDPRLWHRPYVVTRDLAAGRWGPSVAAAVPDEGLVDVHTYATIAAAPDDGRVDVRVRVRVDVTFPIRRAWDGTSHLPLACGDGPDHPAGADPIATKDALVARWCDPVVREPFIAALAGASAINR